MADNLWREHGLMHDQSGMQLHAHSLHSLLNAYRNITFNSSWGGIPEEELIEVPSGFALVNTLMAQLFARYPIIDVTSQNPEEKKAAAAMETTQNVLMRTRNLGMKKQLNRTLLHALITPMGVLRHGFTPAREIATEDGRRIERYQAAKPNVPWIRSWPIWDVRFDTTAETFDPRGDVWWCAFRTLLPIQDIRDNPGMIARDDLHATRTLRERTFLGNRVRKENENPETELVEVWTVYESRERTWFQISDGSDLALRDPDDWPIPWETLPYNVLGMNEQLDTPFPIPPMGVVADQIMERNKVRTMMSQLVKRMRRIVAIAAASLDEDVRARLEGEDPDLVEMIFLKGQSIGDAIREVAMGGFDQGLLLYDDRLTEDMREALGQSLMSRGQRINVDTATEVNSVQQGSDLQAGRLAGPWEDFLSDAVATFGDGLQSPDVIQDELVLPILGRQDARELFQDLELSPFRTVTSGSISGSFIYEIRPGSTSPRNPFEEVEKAAFNIDRMTPFAESVNFPQLLTDFITAQGLDPEKYLTSPQEIEAQRQTAAAGVQTPVQDEASPLPADLLNGIPEGEVPQ
jgi:hypothetical protein